MSQKHILCITNVDQLPGYAMACRLLEEREKLNMHIRCLCREREGLEEIERMGGEIMQVNYQDENKLRQAMKNARCVFLVPENSSHRMKEAENVIKAAKQENVEHMAMKSWIGVEHAKQQDREHLRHMHEYHQIEQKVKQEFKGEKHCVIRTSLYNQIFYLMTPMAEEKQALCLPVKKEAKFGCVDLRDVVDAIMHLVREQVGKSSFTSQKQMYQFTPSQNFKGEQIARGMAMVVDKSPEEFKFHQIDKKEWQKYMRERRKDHRFRERPREEQGTEKPYTMPIGRYFNDEVIEMLYEWFELASQGCADVTTKDLQEVLQHEPRDLQEYFKSNRDQFRRFR